MSAGAGAAFDVSPWPSATHTGRFGRSGKSVPLCSKSGSERPTTGFPPFENRAGTQSLRVLRGDARKRAWTSPC